MKNVILKLFGLFLLLSITLFANTLDTQQTTTSQVVTATTVDTTESTVSEMTEISLDSFGNSGMIIMVILSSLLGMFFVKDEFATALEST